MEKSTGKAIQFVGPDVHAETIAVEQLHCCPDNLILSGQMKKPHTNASSLPPSAGPEAVEELARLMAAKEPHLADLSPDQLERLAQVVLGQRLARDLDRKVNLAAIDYLAERAAFIAQAGRTQSSNTRRAYEAALNRLDIFAARRGVAVMAMQPRDADDYAYALTAEGRSPASVRRDIAGASSFFTFLERRFDAIRNPFRGTKARPAQQTTRKAIYPSMKEATMILEGLEPRLRAAAAVMVYRGLRVGALPCLAIRADRFTARSKGKDLSGELPDEVLRAIKAAGLPLPRPFAEMTETRIADAIRKLTGRLAEDGSIGAAYSAHDFRHLYAITEYRKNHDIYQLSRMLGHASIQVTEVYLRGIGEIG